MVNECGMCCHSRKWWWWLEEVYTGWLGRKEARYKAGLFGCACRHSILPTISADQVSRM